MVNASQFALSVAIVLLASLVTSCGSDSTSKSSAAPSIIAPTPLAAPVPVTPPPEPLIAAIDRVDLVAQRQVQQYLSQLVGQGFGLNRQGVWMQTGTELLANHQGTVPLPAASLTKVATSLATLQTLGADYQFVTLVGRTGTVTNGILQGDLVIQGSGDPLFVWEEAIALGNTLNRLGIRQVTGKLIVLDKFYMNYEQNPQKSGELLKQGMNATLWSAEAAAQFQALPGGTSRPQVVIQGPVQVVAAGSGPDPTLCAPLLAAPGRAAEEDEPVQQQSDGGDSGRVDRWGQSR